jgi:hypothetical protein
VDVCRPADDHTAVLSGGRSVTIQLFIKLQIERVQIFHEKKREEKQIFLSKSTVQY